MLFLLVAGYYLYEEQDSLQQDTLQCIQHETTLEDEVAIEEPIHTYEVLKGRAEPLSDEEIAYDESVRSSNAWRLEDTQRMGWRLKDLTKIKTTTNKY